MHKTLVMLDRPKQPVRAAILGAGYIADFHARAIRAVKGVELVSVCDVSLKTAESFAARWDIAAAFDSIESMLRSQELDVVHVLVPPDQHHPLTKSILQCGINVFVEKPFCISVQESDELLGLAQNRNLRVGVNHNMLF